MPTCKSEAPDMLRLWLLSNERTIRWFSIMIGVSETTVHSWLSNRTRPHISNMILINDLTGVSVNSWLSLEEVKGIFEGRNRIEQYRNK